MRKKGIAIVALLAFTVATGDADARSRDGSKGGRSPTGGHHTPIPDTKPKIDKPEASRPTSSLPSWMKFILKPGRGAGPKCDEERKAKGECR